MFKDRRDQREDASEHTMYSQHAEKETEGPGGRQRIRTRIRKIKRRWRTACCCRGFRARYRCYRQDEWNSEDLQISSGNKTEYRNHYVRRKSSLIPQQRPPTPQTQPKRPRRIGRCLKPQIKTNIAGIYFLWWPVSRQQKISLKNRLASFVTRGQARWVRCRHWAAHSDAVHTILNARQALSTTSSLGQAKKKDRFKLVGQSPFPQKSRSPEEKQQFHQVPSYTLASTINIDTCIGLLSGPHEAYIDSPCLPLPFISIPQLTSCLVTSVDRRIP